PRGPRAARGPARRAPRSARRHPRAVEGDRAPAHGSGAPSGPRPPGPRRGQGAPVLGPRRRRGRPGPARSGGPAGPGGRRTGLRAPFIERGLLPNPVDMLPEHRAEPETDPAFIPLARPDLGLEEEAEVLEAMRSGRLSLGPKAEEFEGSLSA